MKESNGFAEIRKIITMHKPEIEAINLSVQWAIGSLIYLEYIKNFKQVHEPTHKIFIPEIAQVKKLLAEDGNLLNILSNNLIDRISVDERLQTVLGTPIMSNFVMFNSDKIHYLKIIFELQMIPNIVRWIPTVIAQKFNIGNTDEQIFRESSDLDMFERNFPNDDHIDFIINQTVLQLLFLIPEARVSMVRSENNFNVECRIDDYHILSIGNQNAISIIHVDKFTLQQESIKNLISFATGTEFIQLPKSKLINVNTHRIRSSPYNQLVFTKLISSSEDE